MRRWWSYFRSVDIRTVGTQLTVAFHCREHKAQCKQGNLILKQNGSPTHPLARDVEFYDLEVVKWWLLSSRSILLAPLQQLALRWAASHKVWSPQRNLSTSLHHTTVRSQRINKGDDYTKIIRPLEKIIITMRLTIREHNTHIKNSTCRLAWPPSFQYFPLERIPISLGRHSFHYFSICAKGTAI